MTRPALPPAVIGIIGGGQLGMMTSREAQRMGFRSIAWDPDPDCPAGRLADEIITAPFSDTAAADSLAAKADVITYEFEHIDVSVVRMLESHRRVRPGSDILRVSQNRRIEKEELQRNGFPVVAYAIVVNERQLHDAIDRIGLPVVLKTTSAGYDGKGQEIVSSPEEVAAFAHRWKPGTEYAVEKFLELSCELSVVVARDDNGGIWDYPVAQNVHRENILHSSIVPAEVDSRIRAETTALARSVIERFAIVGILCVEMFVTKDGRVLVNELAPRPHNSGHYSLDGCDLSQFEALVRVVTGLPMREPKLLSPCAIVNLLGKHLERLDVSALQKIPGTKLHLYGKKRIEPRRKMGHVAVLRSTATEVLEGIQQVEKMIGEYRRNEHAASGKIMTRMG
ncbi:MAG: 5-(carboxyamino)imidazole ribonucleotide synthase [Bacteroidota bacterium]